MSNIEAAVGRLEQQLGALLGHSAIPKALNDPNAVVLPLLSVTDAYIANATITSAKIGDAQITSAKIVSLDADKIVAGTGIINNLTINATLTLGAGGIISIGAGGRIEDADGSYWDQGIMKLVSAGVVGDAFVMAAGGDDQVYISVDSSQHAIFGLSTGTATNPTSLLLRDGDLILGFEGLGFNTLKPRVQVAAGGVAVTGNTAPDFASGVIGLFIAEALAVPSGTPVGGGVLFVDSGSLKFRTSGGNTRTVAAV